jgi:hypothetical protein
VDWKKLKGGEVRGRGWRRAPKTWFHVRGGCGVPLYPPHPWKRRRRDRRDGTDEMDWNGMERKVAKLKRIWQASNCRTGRIELPKKAQAGIHEPMISDVPLPHPYLSVFLSLSVSLSLCLSLSLSLSLSVSLSLCLSLSLSLSLSRSRDPLSHTKTCTVSGARKMKSPCEKLACCGSPRQGIIKSSERSIRVISPLHTALTTSKGSS